MLGASTLSFGYGIRCLADPSCVRTRPPHHPWCGQRRSRAHHCPSRGRSRRNSRLRTGRSGYPLGKPCSQSCRQGARCGTAARWVSCVDLGRDDRSSGQASAAPAQRSHTPQALRRVRSSSISSWSQTPSLGRVCASSLTPTEWELVRVRRFPVQRTPRVDWLPDLCVWVGVAIL